MGYSKATSKEQENVWDEVNRWSQNSPMAKSLLNSIENSASVAVAEYIANRRGLSLYNNSERKRWYQWVK